MSSIDTSSAQVVAIARLDKGSGRRHDRAVPIYDFACVACDERFDELQRSDAPSPPCPSCGAEETQRLLSPFLVPNSSAGQRAYVRSMPSAHDLGCCGGGGCGTHAG
jgi:putative FmdB family regulatory protein